MPCFKTCVYIGLSGDSIRKRVDVVGVDKSSSSNFLPSDVFWHPTVDADMIHEANRARSLLCHWRLMVCLMMLGN